MKGVYNTYSFYQLYIHIFYDGNIVKSRGRGPFAGRESPCGELDEVPERHAAGTGGVKPKCFARDKHTMGKPHLRDLPIFCWFHFFPHFLC